MKRDRQTVKAVLQQIRRLIAVKLMNDPQEEELTAIALDSYQSIEALDADITQMIRELDEIPTPRQFIAFSQRRNPPKQIGCEKCDHTGFREIRRGHHTAVEPCECRKGAAA